MNPDLQEKLAQRRRATEVARGDAGSDAAGGSSGVEQAPSSPQEELSIADLQPAASQGSASSGGRHRGGSRSGGSGGHSSSQLQGTEDILSSPRGAIKKVPMAEDLKAKMERRKKLADGDSHAAKSNFDEEQFKQDMERSAMLSLDWQADEDNEHKKGSSKGQKEDLQRKPLQRRRSTSLEECDEEGEPDHEHHNSPGSEDLRSPKTRRTASSTGHGSSRHRQHSHGSRRKPPHPSASSSGGPTAGDWGGGGGGGGGGGDDHSSVDASLDSGQGSGGKPSSSSRSERHGGSTEGRSGGKARRRNTAAPGDPRASSSSSKPSSSGISGGSRTDRRRHSTVVSSSSSSTRNKPPSSSSSGSKQRSSTARRNSAASLDEVAAAVPSSSSSNRNSNLSRRSSETNGRRRTHRQDSHNQQGKEDEQEESHTPRTTSPNDEDPTTEALPPLTTEAEQGAFNAGFPSNSDFSAFGAQDDNKNNKLGRTVHDNDTATGSSAFGDTTPFGGDAFSTFAPDNNANFGAGFADTFGTTTHDAFGATSGGKSETGTDLFAMDTAAAFGTTSTITSTPAFAVDAAAFDAASDAFSGDTFGFGSDPVAFDHQGMFDQASNTRGAFDAEKAAMPLKPPEPVWEKDVLKSVPARQPKQLVLVSRTVFSKRFQGYPVTNPLNGNIIFCSAKSDTVYLHEVDPRRSNLQIACVAALSLDLRRKIATKYNVSVHKVDSVLTLTAGIHNAHGQARLRVAALMDLEVLESNQLMRVVTVWQWGYASPQPIALQHVMTPPSGGDFSYDASTLQLADGLLFVAGASPKSPCVFMCKPSVRETWSVNFLTGSGRVAALAVTPHRARTCPYLAVALTDHTLSVWTYASALGSPTGKSNEASKKWLFPLCRLEASSIFSTVEAASPSVEENVVIGRDSKDVGICTSLVWSPLQPVVSSVLMLVAGFQNGMAVFHVRLPVSFDKSKNGIIPLREPTEATQLSQTPSIQPFVAKRWLGKHEASRVLWVDYGPHVNPCLAILMHASESDGGSARVVLGALNLPLYRKGPVAPKDRLVSFNLFAAATFSKTADVFPVGLLPCSISQAVLGFSQEKLLSMNLLAASSMVPANRPDAALASLSHPVASLIPGLTSTADVLLGDAKSNKDGVLHIYTVFHCERRKSELDPSLYDWARPWRRHYLCRTMVGDTKETSASEKKKEDREFGEPEEEKGGAASDVVCEIYDESLVGLVPFRIVRCQGNSICAVLFRPGLGTSKNMPVEPVSLDATSIAIIDFSDSSIVLKAVEGRDIAFFPSHDTDDCHGLILSRDGCAITHFEWKSSAREFVTTSSFRPILGVDDEDFVDCRRLFAFHGASKIGLVLVGTKISDGRECVITGELCKLSDTKPDTWSALLPNIVTGRSFWLEQGEEVFSIIGLEGDDSGYRNFGLATSTRVLILSAGMTISAETKVKVASANLAPLGSFACCFASWDKIRYLCCLDGPLVTGVVSSLVLPKHGQPRALFLAIRPDRYLLLQCHAGARLVENGQNSDTFQLPTAATRPILLLEPMVANAICVGGKLSESTQVLRTVIEKFGRKVATITHAENEGIGRFGAGLTPRVFEMLKHYGLDHAASWLLTGTTKFDRGANSTILPPWLPVASKGLGALNSDGFLHVLAHGDQYLSEYIKSPDQNMASTLPRPSDPSARISRERAMQELTAGKPSNALKMLDFVGTASSENVLVQLALMLEKNRAHSGMLVLKSLSGYGDSGLGSSSTLVRPPASLAALAVTLKKNPGGHEMQEREISRWMKPLAPSLQRGAKINRIRQTILGEKSLAEASGKEEETSDKLWMSECNEAKHVWNEGPRKEKEKLLMLDKIEDWFGRRRPLILGKEGVTAAEERGTTGLVTILKGEDDDSFGGKSDLESEKDGWVEGVGEQRSDEANLSAYFRMSEGEDEDSPWKVEGLVDLSPNQHKALVMGDTESFSLQPSTSSVDEGEPNKVKSLFDLVFGTSGSGVASGLALSAVRGGSIDVGVLHGSEHAARRKCSIEFWFYLPSEETIADEVVLVRRTMGASADDFSKVGIASDKDSVLWELNLHKTTREIEFRSCGGSSMLSSRNYEPEEDNDDDDPVEKERNDLVQFGRWNHVCIVLFSRDEEISECCVSLYMKGKEVVSGDVSMLPPGYNQKDLNNSNKRNEIMQKSHLLFGLGHPTGYRLTELRIWACKRSADDTHTFLYEYLKAAEKKKFKVKMKGKGKAAGGFGKGGALGPPKFGESGTGSRGLIATTKSGMQKSLLAPKPAATAAKTFSLSLAPVPQEKDQPNKEDQPTDTGAPAAEQTGAFDASFTPFGEAPKAAATQADPSGSQPFEMGTDFQAMESQAVEPGAIEELPMEEEDMDVPTTLWDTAVPLSQQVRSSAAAALIRGPPATRHFGGNRGGLPDFSGMERYGVGGVAICGSEKTIVFRDNEDPPALTYPIGASGAVVSDQMDDEGSEFLCCFLAREKRMVVFELQSRTVVVELQMTTKLNFWRYLPPEAAENTLCFMLVTPVGGFHWMPLEESPRPHQVWKRGPDLQGKKVVCYEEGGSNGLEGSDIRSRVGLVMVTRASGAGFLEAWIIPIGGDSQAGQVSDDVMGACLCQPPYVDDGPFLPLLVTVHYVQESIYVNVLSVMEPSQGSVALGEVEVTQVIDMSGFEDVDYDPPALAMGTFPEAICCSLANIIVVIIRRRGLIAAFELEDDDMSLIAQEGVGHYVVDAVMRYSAEVGGAEIVMLLADDENSKDGRMVSFCFRSAA